MVVRVKEKVFRETAMSVFVTLIVCYPALSRSEGGCKKGSHPPLADTQVAYGQIYPMIIYRVSKLTICEIKKK